MSELISKDDALGCFRDWIDRYGHEHTADEDSVYQRIAELKSIEDCDDAISRKMAIDTLHGHFDGMLETDTWSPCDVYGLIELLPAVQPDHNADISEINKFIDGLEEIFANLRERHVDDSVCGLCEYDGAYMGQSGDWCNECPGFDRDDCFKLSDRTRKKWIEEIVNTYPDHTADIGKKASVSCDHEKDHTANISKKVCVDAISRQTAIDMLDEQIELCNKALSAFDISLKDEYAVKVEKASLKAYKEQLENILSVQPEPHWIPCSERMPGNYDYQLLTEEVHYTTGKIVRCVLIAYYDDEDSVWLSAEESPEIISYPVAWMPLPAPYTEEKKE